MYYMKYTISEEQLKTKLSKDAKVTITNSLYENNDDWDRVTPVTKKNFARSLNRVLDLANNDEQPDPELSKKGRYFLDYDRRVIYETNKNEDKSIISSDSF